ncbi:response regulator [Pseudobacteriovorax antillogorgiicola]|uniref:Two-component system, cell cycle response regulator DivK n=1 Tax=Pseudobacteriovorax antillogorgiicola TaxID=1513793 RepID=A0A1Y6CHL3_9BACT|nr:response regulator [Pseudobacteriovorax antillogorgiicola]TCS48340.1 two-component system cell cycle response regulator DivK [Pseudobacteriovorax antillogorgiicola]SMF56377.1 two-component system, cell cycle response regulator DivK [Pseudobacteriovorax antillogorgiicola]
MPDQTKLMVVDDNQVNLELLERRLVNRGFEVIRVSNALEVLAKAKEHRPDLIVLDLYMPEKDGFETAAELKADAELNKIPILGYTAALFDADFLKAKEAGCDDVCAKDGDIKSLLRVVHKLLDLPEVS